MNSVVAMLAFACSYGCFRESYVETSPCQIGTARLEFLAGSVLSGCSFWISVLARYSFALLRVFFGARLCTWDSLFSAVEIWFVSFVLVSSSLPPNVLGATARSPLTPMLFGRCV